MLNLFTNIFTSPSIYRYYIRWQSADVVNNCVRLLVQSLVLVSNHPHQIRMHTWRVYDTFNEKRKIHDESCTFYKKKIPIVNHQGDETVMKFKILLFRLQCVMKQLDQPKSIPQIQWNGMMAWKKEWLLKHIASIDSHRCDTKMSWKKNLTGKWAWGRREREIGKVVRMPALHILYVGIIWCLTEARILIFGESSKMSKDIERYKREHFLCVSHTIETETVHKIGQRERGRKTEREKEMEKTII